MRSRLKLLLPQWGVRELAVDDGGAVQHVVLRRPALIERFARDWGVDPHPDGTRLYADLPLSTARCA